MSYEHLLNVQVKQLTWTWVESGYEVRCDGGVAMVGNLREAEQRRKAFRASLLFKVSPVAAARRWFMVYRNTYGVVNG